MRAAAAAAAAAEADDEEEEDDDEEEEDIAVSAPASCPSAASVAKLLTSGPNRSTICSAMRLRCTRRRNASCCMTRSLTTRLFATTRAVLESNSRCKERREGVGGGSGSVWLNAF